MVVHSAAVHVYPCGEVGETESEQVRRDRCTLKHTPALSSSHASKLMGSHIVQGIGHTTQILEEIVIIDTFYVRAHTVLTAHDVDVSIDFEHSCGLQFLDGDGE